MDNKERFIEIYTKYIKREGADKLLDFLGNARGIKMSVTAETNDCRVCVNIVFDNGTSIFLCDSDGNSDTSVIPFGDNLVDDCSQVLFEVSCTVILTEILGDISDDVFADRDFSLLD